MEYKTDRTGNVHAIIGKSSFCEEQLLRNHLAVVDEILRAKPSAAKGTYVKTAAISSTMGPGIRLDTHRLKDTDSSQEPATV
jgi:large subunit ribosomal protein L1